MKNKNLEKKEKIWFLKVILFVILFTITFIWMFFSLCWGLFTISIFWESISRWSLNNLDTLFFSLQFLIVGYFIVFFWYKFLKNNYIYLKIIEKIKSRFNKKSDNNL